MKHLLTIFLLMSLLSTVFAQNCSNYNWSPSSVWTPSYFNQNGYKYSYQQFKWNATKASNFNALPSNYQYEVKRLSNKWNFFISTPFDGWYQTNMGLSSQAASEEFGFYFPFGPDEEMQVNKLVPGIVPETVYYVMGRYNRIPPSQTMQVNTESEKCTGTNLTMCALGYGFSWCQMNSNGVLS